MDVEGIPPIDLQSGSELCLNAIAFALNEDIETSCDHDERPSSEDPATAPWHEAVTRPTLQGTTWVLAGQRADQTMGYRLHPKGDVGAFDHNGKALWERTGRSLVTEWKLNGTLAPQIPYGYSMGSPYVMVGEDAASVADVDGDAIDDLTVAHRFIEVLNDDEWRWRAIVTLVSGADGQTLWFKTYDGIVTTLVAGREFVAVAIDSGPDRGFGTGIPISPPIDAGRNGTTSRVEVYFVKSPNAPDGDLAWHHEAEPWHRWTDIQRVGRGFIVSSVPDYKQEFPSRNGRVTYFPQWDSQQAAWTLNVDGAPRLVRVDSDGNELLVHSQIYEIDNELSPLLGPEPGIHYQLQRVQLQSGDAVAEVRVGDAVILSVEHDDPTGWLLSELTLRDTPLDALVPPTTETATGWRIRSLAAPSLEERWRQEGQCVVSAGCPGSGTVVWAATPIPGMQRFASVEDHFDLPTKRWITSVHVRDSESGEILDSQWDVDAAASRPAIMKTPNALAVTYATDHQSIVAMDPESALQLWKLAFPGEIFSTTAMDIDGDGTLELVAGGSSRAIFAFDMRPGHEFELIWTAPLDDVVREVKTADLDGDGISEIVAAASSSVVSLDARTGAVLGQADYAFGEFVWTVTVADLDADGRDEVVVPTQTVRAYEEASLDPKWVYVANVPSFEDPLGRTCFPTYFSTAAIDEDANVYAQFVRSPYPCTPLGPRDVWYAVSINGATGLANWEHVDASKVFVPRLFRSVVVLEENQDRERRVAFAMTGDYLPQPGDTGGVSHINWYTTIRFLDAKTGDEVAKRPLWESLTHMALKEYRGELFELDWVPTINVRTNGEYQATAESGYDATAARGQDGSGYWIQSAAYYNWIYRGDELVGNSPAAPASTFRGEALYGGVSAFDFDQDGVDEIVSYTFDYGAFTLVSSYEGMLVMHFDILPRAVTLYKPGPAPEGQGVQLEAPGRGFLPGFEVVLALTACLVVLALARRRP